VTPAAAGASRMPRGAVGLASALACALLLGACGSSGTKNLDVAKVERAIERSIMSQRHLAAAVVCPGSVPQKPGKFACIATTVSPKTHRQVKTPFLVTVHNDKGWVSYIGK
jgi:hypothetical protein